MEPDSFAHRREAFIPYGRCDLIDMCVEDDQLRGSQVAEFRELCQILSAYVHFDFHKTVEEVKKHYAAFDPDREIDPCHQANDSKASAERVSALFENVAERANYFEITADQIRECFAAVTLIDLQTEVDLNDFKQVRCFAKGDVYKTAEVKKLFRRREVRVDVLQRVLLLLHFQDAAYFEQQKKNRPTGEASFQPGKIYLYLYKDVPKFDLELLFPNVEVGMTWKDKLMFGVPAVGGSIGVLVKAAPQILIIIGAIMFFVAGADWAAKVGVTEDSVSNVMPVLTALMGVIVALGGLAFKQWNNYRKKRIEFLKDVSEQLFFRNLATNRSVFHSVIGSAEDEENKEMLLVLYHLIVSREESLTRDQLDARIEKWMKERFGTVIDFDIDGPLENLHALRGPNRDGREVSLVQTDADGRLRAPTLDDAKHIIDHLWDNAFRYA